MIRPAKASDLDSHTNIIINVAVAGCETLLKIDLDASYFLVSILWRSRYCSSCCDLPWHPGWPYRNLLVRAFAATVQVSIAFAILNKFSEVHREGWLYLVVFGLTVAWHATCTVSMLGSSHASYGRRRRCPSCYIVNDRIRCACTCRDDKDAPPWYGICYI